jgi:hypothetical protein
LTVVVVGCMCMHVYVYAKVSISASFVGLSSSFVGAESPNQRVIFCTSFSSILFPTGQQLFDSFPLPSRQPQLVLEAQDDSFIPQTKILTVSKRPSFDQTDRTAMRNAS